MIQSFWIKVINQLNMNFSECNERTAPVKGIFYSKLISWSTRFYWESNHSSLRIGIGCNIPSWHTGLPSFKMKEYQSFAHTRWDCKYHVVFIPKKRKKRIFGVLRKHLGEIFHELAGHKEAKIVEGHIMADHVHMCISIPPKYAVSNVMVGYIKGKSTITIARRFGGRVKNFT